MLQRLTEEFEYSKCLDEAARCEDSCEQLAYIAAFVISAYANTTTRTGKPFNPLLGETFECDRREDYGWRSVAEQVCIKKLNIGAELNESLFVHTISWTIYSLCFQFSPLAAILHFKFHFK